MTGDETPARKSRWAPSDQPVVLPRNFPSMVPTTLKDEEMDALVIRLRIDEITTKLVSGQLDLDFSDDRSPSPDPTYDGQGKRTNTREMRERDALHRERHLLVQKALMLSSHFRPPPDYRPVILRKTKKIFVPVDKFPDYNFIGLIIGPRGLTQKEMEKESGAKIAIRGKGSVKEGKGRSDTRASMYSEDEKLHVLITADSDESLNKASALIEKLLTPLEEGKNEHKRNQLRRLAEINGTLRDNTRLAREFEKEEEGMGIVYCKICNENSHPTRDCPLRNNASDVPDSFDRRNQFRNQMAELEEMSTDFNDRIAELESSLYGVYEQFMREIGLEPSPPARPSGQSRGNPPPPPSSSSSSSFPDDGDMQDEGSFNPRSAHGGQGGNPPPPPSRHSLPFGSSPSPSPYGPPSSSFSGSPYGPRGGGGGGGRGGPPSHSSPYGPSSSWH